MYICVCIYIYNCMYICFVSVYVDMSWRQVIEICLWTLALDMPWHAIAIAHHCPIQLSYKEAVGLRVNAGEILEHHQWTGHALDVLLQPWTTECAAFKP